jgi:monooxygenase
MPCFDVVIVGAGVSGIGTARELRRRCPDHSYVLLERRASLGGTWAKFKYPGFRTDSDMHTFGFSFRPWRERRANGVSGEKVLRYVKEAAAEEGIEPHVRCGVHVLSAAWSTADCEWRISCADGSEYRCRVLCGCAGYYDHDQGYTPDLPGLGSFENTLVHPHNWDPAIEVAGQRIVVIGSGVRNSCPQANAARPLSPRADAAPSRGRRQQ